MSSEICLEFVDSLAYTGELSTIAKTSETDEGKSGILERNGLVWYASGSLLEVFNINSDFKVIHWNFNDCTRRARKSKTCTVECVEEVVAFQRPLLAVGLRLGPEQTQIMVLSPQGVYEVGNINMQEDVSILRFIDPSSCSLGVLRQYCGCLAVGTIDGKVIMVDLCLNQVENGSFGSKIAMNDETKKHCHIEFNGGDSKQTIRNHEKIRERGLYFGLQFSHDVEASVESILDVPPLKACCVGYADGTILIVDLVDQSLMHRILPPAEDCAVIAMNFVEPSDDPMACLYLWAFYAHDDGAFALLHMIMCEEKFLQDDVCVYEQFQSCSTRLSLPSYDPGSVPLQVQSVTKQIGEDELITLSVLSWLGSDRTTTVLVFDLNQWYKAEMPYECDWQDELTHMVVFKLNEPSFYAQLDERSLKPFHSIQRPEEHFYPNSLEFEITNFNGFHRTRYRWIGLQKKLLRYLDLDGANSVIEPSSLYQVLNRAALMPLFYDQLPCEDDSTKMQREFILSLGLEYNCHAFLQSCVCLWADGSHLGADPERGVSLSTLTDWIWNRSAALKELSNRTLAPLLDSAGPRVDAHTNRNLSRCTEQMKQLARLYATILSDCKKVIPKEVLKKLTKECASIAVAAQYQDILLWLLSVGLLPEVSEPSQDAESGEESKEKSLPTEALRVPYPYTRLDEFYRNQRATLHEEEEDANPSSEATRSCKLLFIDNLIEREFDPASIRKVWFDESDIANDGALLYPPESLQKALRVLLIPEAAMQQKLVLLSYLFMDIVAVLGRERYGEIFEDLENFPQMYNMNAAVVQRVKAFWHLDHGHVETAVEEFLSPVSVMVDYPKWHRELAVTVLLRLNSPRHALLVLQNQGCHVPPQLELTTLVRNNRIDDAYRLQRRQPQPDGMLWFAETVLKEGKAKALLEIGFTEEEKFLLRSYLRECPRSVCDSLLFGHLLLNGEFVEAIQHVDRLTTRKRNDGTEAYRDILSLYHKALDPTSQRLAYLTYAEPKELEPRLTIPTSPGGQPTAETLSARLIRNRADFRVRILHQSIVATKEAAEATGLLHERPFLDKPDLGVFQRRPMVRSSNVSYPILVSNPSKGNKRRRHESDLSYDEASTDRRRAQHFDEEDAYLNPSKRRNLGTDGRRYANLDTPVPVIPQIRPMVPKFNFTAATASTTFSAGGSDRSGKSHLAKSVSHSPSIFLQTPPLFKKDRKDAESPASEAADSYTPPGILKPTQSGLTFAAPDGEEKVLRFVLPPEAEGATVDGASCLQETATDLETTSINTPQPEERASRRDLDLSGISNEDFYSPEVTMDDNSLQQLLCSGGPSRRRPLHRSSLSGTPTGSNIAIIIEDHVDDECPNVADEPVDYEPMEVDDGVEVAEDVVLGMATNEEQQTSAQSAESDGEEIILLEDREGIEGIIPEGDDDDYEVVLDDDEEEQEEELSVEEDHGAYDEEEDNGSYDEDGEDLLNGELDNSGADESDGSGASSSVMEVIDVDDEMFSSSSVSSSSSSSSSGNGGAEQQQQQHATMATPAEVVADEPPRQQVEPGEASAVGAQQMHYDEFYSESVPRALFNAEDEDVAEDDEEEEHEEEEREEVQEQGDDDERGVGQEEEGQQGEESHYIQVPTTSSSTHRTEAQEIAATSAESSEVEDLSVCQQQDTAPEIADSSVASVGATGAVRDLSVAGEQWEDGVASTSGNEEVVRLTPSATAGTSTATTAVAVSVPVSTAAQPAQQPFARPKNAHELEVPAMNLSVKPDEAHGSSRKNSKGEENGLTEEARALNLSAGQQELAAQMANAGNNNKENANDDDEEEDDGDDGGKEKDDMVDDNEPQCSDEAKTDDKTAAPNDEGEDARENEPQSSDEAQAEEPSANSVAEDKVEDRPVSTGEDGRIVVEAVNEEEKMDITLQVSDEEGESEMQTPPSAGPSATLETRERNEPEENIDPSGDPAEHGDNGRGVENAQEATTVKEEDEGKVEQNPPVNKTKEALLREQEEEASTSSPRANVRTRLMIAMEKSSTTTTVTPSLGTPTRRRSMRATSVAPETSNTPLTPSLSRSRRYTSMDNVSGVTPDLALPLTPRRSTRRASSLAKELFASSTPQKRARLHSHSSVESVDRAGGSIPNSPTDAAAAMEPPEPSEKSFASSTASSTRRSTRGRKPKEFAAGAESQQTGTATGALLSDYSSNRRLTRHQLAVMEKSMEIMASSSGQGRALRASRLDVSVDAGGESEAESVASNVSNQSSLRSTRSRTTRTTATRRTPVETRSNRGGSVREGSIGGGGQQQPAEPSEMDSDSDHSLLHASQRTTHGLEPIAEEADETQPGTTKKRRGRPPKSHK
uniref:ELYS-like domain-containing protein n=1 Tax=Anopheles atroparvus TaxID=41427 RepID=A0A182IJH8_ANOAO